jgi:vancomycin resistance protein VanJ
MSEVSAAGAVRTDRSRPWRRRPLLKWVLRLFAVYGCLASLQLAAIAVMRDGWVETYAAALVFFWWLVPAPLLLVLAVVARGWRTLVTLLAPTVVIVYLIGPYLLHALPGVLPSDRADLRVATYNLSKGRPVDGLVQLVAEHRPDVLLLQENTRSHDELARLLPAYPDISAGTGVNSPGDDSYAIASRYPIRSVAAVTGLPAGARPTDLVTIDVRGTTVHLLSLHLASPCFACLSARQNPAGFPAQAAQVRVAEARRFADVVRDLVRRGDPVVVAGDLNASPLNQPLGELTDSGLVDAQAAVGTTPGLTRGAGPGIARVDAVLVSGLRPARAFEGGRGESDHAPVVADLAWPRS